MSADLPPVRKARNQDGTTEYHIEADAEWDGFDAFVRYLKTYWQAEVGEAEDWVSSRRWVLHVRGVPVSVYHDSRIGNYFLREDDADDQSLLEEIEADLLRRLG
jgi:hypothetical protein